MINESYPKRFNTLFSVKASLISLYLALTFPIIFITIESLKLVSTFCLICGLIFIFNITNDYVITDEKSIVLKTSLISNLFGKNGWEILWKDIINVKSFSTSQGSKVHYLITSSQKSFLIPQRLERFDEFKEILVSKIKYLEIDLNYISPLWTYKFLTLISGVMFLGEIYAFILKI